MTHLSLLLDVEIRTNTKTLSFQLYKSHCMVKIMLKHEGPLIKQVLKHLIFSALFSNIVLSVLLNIQLIHLCMVGTPLTHMLHSVQLSK